MTAPLQLPKLTPPAADRVHNFFMPVFWGASGNRQVAEIARAMTTRLIGGFHFADNFLTWGRNNSMFDDAPFVASWRDNAAGDAISEAIVWRRYILACAAYHAVHLDGDFVECGCYKGTGVKTVVDYLGGRDFPKTFWAYDLFEHSDDDAHHAMPAHGPDLYQQVRERFAEYPTVRIVRGRIPEVFAGESPERIAYLHIDLNQAPAEIAALDALFDRIVPGGVLILDDYEWALAYRGQKLAEDPWFDARSYRVFPLPTGQGIVLKR
jgi:O-methyltransferase